MKKLIPLALIFPLLLSCGKEETTNENTDVIIYNDENSSKEKGETTIANSAETVNQIVIKAQEDMTFDKTEFVVRVGEEVTLTLVNVGTSSKEAMGHNLILLNQGVDTSSFTFDASSEKANQYIPSKRTADIIAHTKLLGPKENDQIKFTIDQAGTYEFICSFPGHSGTMRGKITAI